MWLRVLLKKPLHEHCTHSFHPGPPTPSHSNSNCEFSEDVHSQNLLGNEVRTRFFAFELSVSRDPLGSVTNLNASIFYSRFDRARGGAAGRAEFHRVRPTSGHAEEAEGRGQVVRGDLRVASNGVREARAAQRVYKAYIISKLNDYTKLNECYILSKPTAAYIVVLYTMHSGSLQSILCIMICVRMYDGGTVCAYRSHKQSYCKYA